MPMRAVQLALALSIVVVTAPLRAALAQHGVIVAHVAELRVGQAIDDAEVVAMDEHRVARTNEGGVALLADLPQGTHRIRVRKPGYAAVELELPVGRDTTRTDVYLERLATHLDTVRVLAAATPVRLRDFAIRRAQGLGHFLDDTLLAREGNREFAIVAEAHLAGLRIQTDAEGRDHLVSTRGACGASSSHPNEYTKLGSTSGGGRGAGGGDGSPTTFGTCTAGTTCPIVVYLDGMRMGQEDVDLDFVRTWDLAGVEYYTASTVPARYRISGAACGVMLLWSR